MFKIAAIIGGVLLMAGVALAGTLTSVDSTNSPTIGNTTLPATSTNRQDDRGRENELRGRENEPGEEVRGRENELRGRENEPGDDRGRENELRGREDERGEDLRGPCDELEHANDPRCSGAATAPRVDDDVVEDRGDDNRGDSSGPGPNSGASDRSGHHGDDGGGHSGHGGGGGDDD